jgi:general secretion pathway protein H
VTLVEVLVVLALIGTVASAVGLSLSPTARGTEARGEAELLVARMRRASEETLLTGRPVALVWSERSYRFLALVEGSWIPHPTPLLGEAKTLDAGVLFQGEVPHGGFAVTSAALPAGGSPIALLIGTDGGDPARAVVVSWNGATATLLEPGE